MAVLMVTEQKSRGREGLGHGGGSSTQGTAHQADWGAAAQSNLYVKLDC